MTRRTSILRSRILVGILVCLGNSQPARGSGFSVLTFGTRRVAMLSSLAKPDDVTALFHNPAGLADQPGVQLYVFIAGGFTSLRAELAALDPDRWPAINPYGCGAPGRDPCPWPVGADGYYVKAIRPERYWGAMPFIGASTDLGFIGRKAKNVVVSMAAYGPNFYGAYLPEDAPSAYHIVGGMFLVGALTWGAGWRINRYVSVGADVSYNFMYLTMAQKYSMVDTLTPPGQPPDNVAILAQELVGDIRMDYSGVDHGAGWGVGIIVSPVPWLRLGLRYAGATQARFKGGVRYKALGESLSNQEEFHRLVSAMGYKLPDRLIVEMPIPHTFQVGFNVEIGPRVEFGMDFRFWFYNLYKKQVIVPLYDPAEPGEEPLTREGLTRRKNYDMSFQVTGGILVRPSPRVKGLELMAGTGFVSSPIPDETFSLDNPMLHHFKVTGGARWQINRNWRLGVAYQLNIYIARDITTSRTHPPPNVRGTALAHVPAVEMTYRF